MHLVGVGGAGMSAYARAAHALGAEVSGSDARERPYLERLRADGVLERARRPRGREHPRRRGRRALLLLARFPPRTSSGAPRASGASRSAPARGCWRELTALRRTIAVAGTHGKTTTAAMLVHALRGRGPGAGLAGRRLDRRRARRTRHWSEGEWLVVEADESDRSMLSLSVEIALLDERRARPPRELRLAGRSCARPSAQFLARPRWAVIWDRPELLELRDGAARRLRRARADAHRGRLALPLARARGVAWRSRARTTRSTRPARSRRRGSRAPEAGAIAGAGRLPRRRPALSAARRKRPRGARVRRLRPPPDRGRGDAAGRRARSRTGGWWPSSSRTCTRAPRRSRASSGARWPAPTWSRVLDVYPARERAEDIPGRERAADRRGGGRRRRRQARVLAARRSPTPRRVLAGVLGEGDVCVVMGAGDVDAPGPARLVAP